MAEFKPIILKNGLKALAVIGDILRFPDAAIFDSFIRIGNSADTTNGNVRYDGNDFFARVGGIWKSLTRQNYADMTYLVGTTNSTTTSSVFATIPDLTTTPAAGKYKVEVSLDVIINANGTVSELVLQLGGTSVSGTLRTRDGSKNTTCTINMLAVVDANGSQVLDVKFRAIAGSINVRQRAMLVTRIN